MLKASDCLKTQSNQCELRRRWHDDFTRLIEALCQLETAIATHEDKSSLVNQLLACTSESGRLLSLSPNPEKRRSQAATLREYAILIRNKLIAARDKLSLEFQIELEQTLAQIEVTLEKFSEEDDLFGTTRYNIETLHSLVTKLASDTLKLLSGLAVCDAGTVCDLFQQAEIEQQIKAIQDAHQGIRANLPLLAEEQLIDSETNLAMLNINNIIDAANEVLKRRPNTELAVQADELPRPAFNTIVVDQQTAFEFLQENHGQVASEIVTIQDKPVDEFFYDLNEHIVPVSEANLLQDELCAKLPAIASKSVKLVEENEKKLDELQKRLQQVLILRCDLLASLEAFNQNMDDVKAQLDRPFTFSDLNQLEKFMENLEKQKPNKHLTEGYAALERSFNELLKYYHDLITSETEESIKQQLTECRKRIDVICKLYKTRVSFNCIAR